MLRFNQEALSTILTRALASQIVISLRPSAKNAIDGALIEIVDDGRGIDIVRARALHGEYVLASVEGEGARMSSWRPEKRGGDDARAG